MSNQNKAGASIWHRVFSVAELQEQCRGNMFEHVGIEFLEVGTDFIRARMPVDHRTKQRFGILHGGASVVLAESLGSVASTMMVDLDKFRCVGLEINANHIRSATEGFVEGTVRPLHTGRSTHLWDIRLTQGPQLVCISRLTMAVLAR